MLKKGILIAFEGIDGSGKSTQAKKLYGYLQKKDFQVVLTREPSDGVWGKKIRGMAHKIRDTVSPEEELELFIKDREDHVSSCIEPSLRKKNVVITDRYYYSTIAYQGALGINEDSLKRAGEGFPVPDMVLYLKIDTNDGLKRIKEQRKDPYTQFERGDYLEKVKGVFDSFDLPYFHQIDAALGSETVFENICKKVDNHLSLCI